MTFLNFLAIATALCGTAFSAPALQARAVTCPASNQTTYTTGSTNWIIECGWDRSGGTMAAPNGQTAATLEDCIDQCINRAGCVLADWSSGPKACYLKSSVGAVKVNSGVIGARFVVAPSTSRTAGQLRAHMSASISSASTSSTSSSRSSSSSSSSISSTTSRSSSTLRPSSSSTTSSSSPSSSSTLSSSSTRSTTTTTTTPSISSSTTSSRSSSSISSTTSSTTSIRSSSSSSSSTSSKPSSSSSSASASSSSSSTSSSTRTTTTTTTTSSTSSSASASATNTTGGIGKRGVPYNNGTYTKLFGGSGSKVSWMYDWFSAPNESNDPNSAPNPGLKFVPLLWNTSPYLTSIWNKNAEAAIAAGADTLLAFNEPDLASQANLSPADAAAAYKTYMQPFAGRVRLGAPAITNGGPPMGVTWMQQFLGNCTECTVDVIPIHWYDSASNIGYLKYYIPYVYGLFNKPLWLTEFGASGDSTAVQGFLKQALPFLDGLDYLERYAYFFGAPSTGNNVWLVNSDGTALSDVGKLYNTL